jgi:translation initiation factor eIF-2B subunit alpha
MNFDIKQTIQELTLEDPQMSLPVITVKALVEFTRSSTAKTHTEYIQTLHHLTTILKQPGNPVSYHAGIDLFISFVSKLSHLESFKYEIIQGAEQMIAQCDSYREECARQGYPFVKENSGIMIHSYSRLVMLLLLRAQEQGKQFRVYVIGGPRNSGMKAMQELRGVGIPTCVITDASMGYYMDKVDMVIVGAEGVVRNGGIINQIGTNPLSIVAKQHKKPVYCVAERYSCFM